MPTFRFSILTLFGVTAYVAVGAAALIHPAPLWQSILHGAVVFGVLVALLRAVYCRPQDRAFWVGFVIFGSAYFVLTAILTPPCVPLPTTPAITYIGYLLGKTDMESLWPIYDPFGSFGFSESGIGPFYCIGHALFTLPFACLGGIIARVLHARSFRDGGNTSSESSA